VIIMSEASSFATRANVRGSGETILLVEDQEFVREVMFQVLRSAGYLVLQAANAEEARSVFCRHQGPVHLLLTDMVMPGKNGAALATELAVLSPGIKTLLTSGYANNIVEEHCHNRRISFLPKPFSIHSLTRKIRDVLDEKESCLDQTCAVFDRASGFDNGL
jgi:DNA-binding NtrC family response regulator